MTAAHQLDTDAPAMEPATVTFTPSTVESFPDPELPKPSEYDDLTTAGKLADFALAKLRRYAADSPGEIPSHHIELAVRLGELYERLAAALDRRQRPEPPAPSLPTSEVVTEPERPSSRHLSGELAEAPAPGGEHMLETLERDAEQPPGDAP